MDSFSAFVGHARRRNVDYKIGFTYCVLSLVGAQFGALLTASAPAVLLQKAFAFFMLSMLIVFLLKPKMGLRDRRAGRSLWGGVFAGLFIGFMIGLFGGGVGVLLILCLVFVSGTTVLLASGTQQLIIWVTNFSAIYAYHRFGLIDYRLGVSLGFFALVGAQLGVRVAHAIGNNNLRRMLFIVVVASALKLLVL